MANIALQVEGLGKMFRIGSKREHYATLRDTLTDAVAAPFRRAQSLMRGEAYGAAGLTEEIWALKDVSFEIHHGEVVGIIGRNGAGKSTLLKILSRITEPTEGYAEVYGRVGSLLEVGTGFHPELTGRENIYLNGAILGMSREEINHKFDEIVDFASVRRFIDTPVKHYSSGMGLRLGFAVAAYLEPEILLVDEVLAVGDAAFQKKCLAKMDNVAKSGRTVLFVSHQMSAIQGLCDRVIVLDAGQVIYRSKTDDAIRFYLAQHKDRIENIKLNERIDRTGHGAFRFKGISFKDATTLQPLQTILSGQDVLIEIDYQTSDRIPLGLISVVVSFWTMTGQLMFACSNEAVNYSFDNLSDIGTIECLIPKWPLSGGIYSYNLYASTDKQVADWIKEAGFIEVETGDFFRTGHVTTMKQSMFVEHAWRLI